MTNENKKYYLLGFFYLTIQILIIYLNQGVKSNDIFFWFCNHAPIIFAIAFFTQQFDIIKALINVGLISQLTWTLDLLSKLLFNTYIFEVTSYIFEPQNTINMIYPIIIHVFSTLVALYFTYNIKPTTKTLYLSLLYTILLFIFTILYTSANNDINCVYNACNILAVNPKLYLPIWPIMIFTIMVIPTHAFQKWLYLKTKK